MGNQMKYSEMKKLSEQVQLIYSLECLCKTYIELAEDHYIPRESEGGEILHDAFTRVIAIEGKKLADITIPQPSLSDKDKGVDRIQEKYNKAIATVKKARKILKMNADEWMKEHKILLGEELRDLSSVYPTMAGAAAAMLRLLLEDLGEE